MVLNNSCSCHTFLFNTQMLSDAVSSDSDRRIKICSFQGSPMDLRKCSMKYVFIFTSSTVKCDGVVLGTQIYTDGDQNRNDDKLHLFPYFSWGLNTNLTLLGICNFFCCILHGQEELDMMIKGLWMISLHELEKILSLCS